MSRNILLSIILLTSILMTTLVYSAYNTRLNIEGEAIVRSDQYIRITNITVSETTNNAYETYNNKYNKDVTFMYATLPANSSITYTVEITNKNTISYIIDSISQETNTNQNISIDISLNINDIVNANNTKTFTIKLTNNTSTTQEETLAYKYGFKLNQFTVIFDPNGGTVSPTSKQVSYGLAYGSLPTPNSPDEYYFKGWSLLPDGYQQVEYIELTGTQYIDTGYRINGNMKFVSKVYSSLENTEMAIVAPTNNTSSFEIGYGSDNTFFNWSTNSIKLQSSSSIYNRELDFTATLNNNEPYKELYLNNIDNGLYISGGAENQDLNGIEIRLFKIQNIFPFIGKMYYMRIYDNDQLVRNYIPCYRKSDNKPGLYDMVNNVFYTNQGTGEFSIGTDTYITSSTIVNQPRNHTLTAVYELNPYIVTFDPNGGNVNPTQKRVKDSEKYGTLPVPIKQNYTFMGWKTENLVSADYFEDGGIYDSGGGTVDESYINTRKRFKNFFSVESGKTYYTKVDSPLIIRGIHFYDNNNNWITYIDVMDNQYTFSIPSNCKTIKIVCMRQDGGNFSLAELNDANFNLNKIITSNTIVTTPNDHTLTALWYKNSFDYTRTIETFKAPYTGKYQLEVWGASGAGCYDDYVGYGGYSTGEMNLTQNEILYIYVGESGTTQQADNTQDPTFVNGGWNGGGSGYVKQEYASYLIGSGGGATDIRRVKASVTYQNNAFYTDDNTSLQSRIIVAGGGGGAGHNQGEPSKGGHAGGFIGNTVTTSWNDSHPHPTGGTQTTGLFGYGATPITTETTDHLDYGNYSSYCAGGAGGGWYGGAASIYQGCRNFGGAGGSGYIGSSSLSNKLMFCYNCQESNDTDTFTVSTTGTSQYIDSTNCPNGYSTNPISKCAKLGNGYARITFLG